MLFLTGNFDLRLIFLGFLRLRIWLGIGFGLRSYHRRIFWPVGTNRIELDVNLGAFFILAFGEEHSHRLVLRRGECKCHEFLGSIESVGTRRSLAILDFAIVVANRSVFGAEIEGENEIDGCSGGFFEFNIDAAFLIFCHALVNDEFGRVVIFEGEQDGGRQARPFESIAARGGFADGASALDANAGFFGGCFEREDEFSVRIALFHGSFGGFFSGETLLFEALQIGLFLFIEFIEYAATDAEQHEHKEDDEDGEFFAGFRRGIGSRHHAVLSGGRKLGEAGHTGVGNDLRRAALKRDIAAEQIGDGIQGFGEGFAIGITIFGVDGDSFAEDLTEAAFEEEAGDLEFSTAVQHHGVERITGNSGDTGERFGDDERHLVDVDCGGNLLRLDVFGSEVTGCTEELTGGGEFGDLAGVDARDTEIENFHRFVRAAWIDEVKVLGLEILVHDAEFMTDRKRFENRSEQDESAFGAERSDISDFVAQVAAMEHFHGDIGLVCFGYMTVIVDSNDVIMTDFGGDFGFAEEALGIGCIDTFFGIHDLESDVVIEGNVVCAIDGCESACTEDALDFVSAVDNHPGWEGCSGGDIELRFFGKIFAINGVAVFVELIFRQHNSFGDAIGGGLR